MAFIGQARPVELLGLDGKPLRRLEVPFIQWLPNGQSIGQSIDRGPEIYALAAAFIKQGGRYACVKRLDGMAEIVAGFHLDDGAKGEMLAVADETVPDGPQIGPAIDRVVRASNQNLHKYSFHRDTP